MNMELLGVDCDCLIIFTSYDKEYLWGYVVPVCSDNYRLKG